MCMCDVRWREDLEWLKKRKREEKRSKFLLRMPGEEMAFINYSNG